ncbi:hypothetical protein ILUMI_10120 [Ignelater luminosus]|uniref:trypsin n=1 Tax=Ignelater luminosus TaxID=2038154 RepID=A0A8K0D7R6_IGNLU|nr:hypothetical protein ILUMI_10120 [Ignelater luminosus]
MGLLNVLIVVEIIYQGRTKPKCGRLQSVQIRFQIETPEEYKRIVGGMTTNISTHIAALLIQDTEDLGYSLICATVIISLHHSLTACHCIDIMENYTGKVRSGSAYWQKDGILHDIEAVIRNEQFNQNYLDNDIAILYVRPHFYRREIVLVAGPNYKLLDGSYIKVTGWGERDQNRSNTKYATWSETLYTVDVQVINNKKCSKMITQERSDYYDETELLLQQSQFCAGLPEGGRDACIYDSGGPAVQNNVLVGIISSGASICGHKNFPGIYVHIPNVNRWIKNMSRIFNFEVRFDN